MIRLSLLSGPFLLVAPALAQSVLVLDQPPNQTNVIWSDEDCDRCGGLGTFQQSVAESFSVTVDPGSAFFTLEEIVVWGGHDVASPPADHFWINVHSGFGGTPDQLLYSEYDVAHTAVPTGANIYATYEVEYTFALANPPQLGTGVYWIEIYNDTTGDVSTWGWESGTLDGWSGTDDFAFSEYAPGTLWWPAGYVAGSPSNNCAMQVRGTGALPTGPVRPLCYGQACPCGNDYGAGGCSNSTGTGARLSHSGTASIAADDLELIGSNLLPGKTALLFSGGTALGGGGGLLFGDGLRCAGQGVRRLGVANPDASGTTSWSGGLAAMGGWSPGDTTYVQVWYADPTGSACSSGFNLTNALEVVWQP